MRNVQTWAAVAQTLQHHPPLTCVRIPKRQVEHPTAAGMTRSLGLPVNQLADWRMPPPNCHGLHVREYGDHYTAHVDHVNPRCDLPGHLVDDAPLVGSGAALGALAGLMLGKNARSMLVGAVLGGAIGAWAASLQEHEACAAGCKHRAGT